MLYETCYKSYTAIFIGNEHDFALFVPSCGSCMHGNFTQYKVCPNLHEDDRIPQTFMNHLNNTIRCKD
jgi:hypothetical protein